MKADGPCPGSVANPEASCSASGVLRALGPGSVLLCHPPQPRAMEDQEYGSPGEDGDSAMLCRVAAYGEAQINMDKIIVPLGRQALCLFDI